VHVKGALQLLMNRYGSNRFAQVPERVSTKSFVVLIIGNSKSNHFGAQGTLKYVRSGSRSGGGVPPLEKGVTRHSLRAFCFTAHQHRH